MIPRPDQTENIEQYISLWKGFRNEFKELIRSVPDADFNSKPEKGGWNAAQIAEHLYLSQFFLARAIPGSLGGKIGAPASEAPAVNYDEVEEAMEKPRGIQNPVAVTPSNDWDKQTAIDKLDTAMNRFEKAVKGRSLAELRSRALPHGIFNFLVILDFIWTLVMHERLHLAAAKAKFADS